MIKLRDDLLIKYLGKIKIKMRPEFPQQCPAPSQQARLLFYYCSNHKRQPTDTFDLRSSATIHGDLSKQKIEKQAKYVKEV